MTDGPFSEAFGVFGKFSSHVPFFERRKSADVFLEGIPKASALETPVENVFSENGFSGLVSVTFVTPFPQSFRVQKPGVVAEFRRLLVESAEPEARAFRSRYEPGFRYAVFVSRWGTGNESADFREFEL